MKTSYDKLKREFVVNQFFKGKTRSQILQAGKEMKLNRMFIKRTLDRFQETQSTEDRQRPGRPKSSRTPAAIKKIRDKIRKNPRQSMRKMAKEQGMSPRTMRRLVTGDLQMRPFKIQSRQLLGTATKAKRLARAKLLRKKLRDGTLRNIVFSDEKLFTVQASFNHQNDRVLSRDRQSILEHYRQVYRTQKPASVMVWAAVSESGKSPLVFIPQGVKINRDVYIRDILEGSLKPWAMKQFRGQHWTFQQDGATSHTACQTQQWCQNNCPGFISKDQ